MQASPFIFLPNSVRDDIIVPKERIIIYPGSCSLPQLAEHVAQMRSLDELVIEISVEDDKSYDIIEFILNNSALRRLEIQFRRRDFGSNAYVTSEQMQLLANCLSKNKTIKKLILSDHITSVLTDKQSIEILAKAINGSSVESLELSDIPEFILDPLFDLLYTNRNLKRLVLNNTKGVGSGFDRFVLSSNITKLQLSLIPPIDNVLTSIVNILRNSTKLELFELNIFYPENYSDLSDAIAANRSLKTLIIDSSNTQLIEDVQLIVLAVKCHPTIESFKILGISPEGMKIITGHLLENSSNNILRSLTINKRKYSSGNDLLLDVDHLKNFAAELATNTTLKHLFLGKFHIEEPTGNDSTLLNALKANTTLQTLDLHPKSIITTKEIIDLLQYNKALTKISLKEIYVKDLTSFYNAIMQHQNLTSLDISQMTYQENEKKLVQFISDLIVYNTTLKELKCSGIQEKRRKPAALTLENILPSLKYNYTLDSLDLFAQSKDRTESELKIIADVFSANKTLVQFNSEVVKRRDIDPYLKRNREYRVDAVILWCNIVRQVEKVFPIEIWQHILQSSAMFSLAMKTWKAKRNKIF